MQKLNLIGQKFERLTVIEEADAIVGTRKRSAWKCRCDCGNIKIIKQDSLRDGSTKSCGCLNREKTSQRAKKMYLVRIKYTPEEASANKTWRHRYKDGNLTFEEFYELSKKDCYYCGNSPLNIANCAKGDYKASDYAKENGDFVYNGLDRVDSSKGHEKDNVVPCCKWCNYAKRERSVEEFLQWVENVYQNCIIRRSLASESSSASARKVS